jgi:polyisoprenoid-binding protein YceI
MELRRKIVLIATLFLLLGAVAIAATVWHVEPKTKAQFSIDALFGLDVEGTVDFTRAEIDFNPADLSTATFMAVLDVQTLTTSISARDGHLKTDDFFEVEKYPYITFISTSVEENKGHGYWVNGTLTIKNVISHVKLPFHFKPTESGGLFTSDFTINRLTYGIGKPSIFVGKEVRIHLVVPVKADN